MPISLNTIAGKQGAKLTTIEFDTNFKIVETTLNDNAVTLASILSRLTSLEQAVNALTTRIAKDESSLVVVATGVKSNIEQLSLINADIKALQDAPVSIQLKVLQNQVLDLTAAMATKVSVSSFNTHIAAINTTLISR